MKIAFDGLIITLDTDGESTSELEDMLVENF